MFPNRGQFISNTDRRGFSPPIGAYSIRYRQVQENFAKELEERKKEEKKRISERFRFNAEETLRRQKENRDKRKAFEAAEERHRKETLNQRKQQQRQVLTQAKVTTNRKSSKSFKTNLTPTNDRLEFKETGVKRASSFQSQQSQPITTSKLVSYDSEPNLNVLKRHTPRSLGQGRILLAVDANASPYNEIQMDDDEKGDENRSSMNTALEQLIEELKQPNLDIERFTKQMSTAPFSAKSNKYPTNYSQAEPVKLLFSKTLTEHKVISKKDPPTTLNTWISPSTDPITPTSPIIPTEQPVTSEYTDLCDSLDARDSFSEVLLGDEVVSLESDSTCSNSPPLSPTLELVEPAIVLQDSLEEPRIPTPPLPDLVPFLPAPEMCLHSNTSPSYISPEHQRENYRWDWVGLAENSKKKDLPNLSAQTVKSQVIETEVPLPTKLVGILKTSKSPTTHNSKRRVRFAGAQYMTLPNHSPASTLFPHATFPYRVSTPSKGHNLNSLSVIGESKSLNSTNNPIALTKTNTQQQQEAEFSLDSTPTDVDIHVIWTQIRENLRKSNSAVTAKKYYNNSDDSYKSVTKVLSKRQHPKINRVSIAPKTSDSDLIAWSEQQREQHPSELSIEENKVLASLARLDTQLEAKQAYLRSMKSQTKQTKSNYYSNYKNR